jgi:UDP-N-acetylglucosamine acyltransferase
VIGADVDIGDGTTIGPHVVIEGATRIGRDNRIFQFASIGAIPQDKKFGGEKSQLVIGDRNLIREFVTLNRGTGEGGGATRIGNDNWIMAYVHVAHDCRIGNHTIFANGASLAGHSEVDDWAILAGYSGVHQFCKVGAHAITGFQSHVSQDVPPFMTVSGNPLAAHGVNVEGLRRRGFSKERIALVRQAAGSRIDEIELNIRVFFVAVTDDRAGVLSGVAGMFGVTEEMVAASPFALVGSASSMVDELLRRRDELGFSYLIVGGDDVEPFAPVVAELAGK